MAVPSQVKIKKDGVEYISQGDLCSYTMAELGRAALKDVGKFVASRARAKTPKKKGRARKAIQYWVRKRDVDLQIGIKPSGFYAGFYELGSSKTPKLDMIRGTVMDNIAEIRKIVGQYLGYIAQENKALGIIDESEELSDDG